MKQYFDVLKDGIENEVKREYGVSLEDIGNVYKRKIPQTECVQARRVVYYILNDFTIEFDFVQTTKLTGNSLSTVRTTYDDIKEYERSRKEQKIIERCRESLKEYILSQYNLTNEQAEEYYRMENSQIALRVRDIAPLGNEKNALHINEALYCRGIYNMIRNVICRLFELKMNYMSVGTRGTTSTARKITKYLYSKIVPDYHKKSYIPFNKEDKLAIHLQDYKVGHLYDSIGYKILYAIILHNIFNAPIEYFTEIKL